MRGRTRVSVVGLGYVGLTTAACLAEKFDVTGIDVDERKVEQIGRGAAPFSERSLTPLLKRQVRNGSLKCTTGYEGVGDSEFVFVTVGTPSDSSGRIDLSHVRAAAHSVGDAISGARRRRIDVLVKSTVIPGTARRLVKRVIEERSGRACGEGFGLCSNPEFLREGSAIEDTMRPSRIVIGPFDSSSGRRALSLYKKFYGERMMPPVVETTPEMAELIKYASNAFLAMKVSFINTVARICEKIPQGHVDSVARGIGLDNRIGTRFMEAGPGFGGSCFPKDIKALIRFAQDIGVDASLLEATLKVNETQPEHILSTADSMLRGLNGRKVAILGLSFKPDTDDVRESRSMMLIEKLIQRGAKVAVYDPVAMERARSEIGSNADFTQNVEECLEDADLAIVMTSWDEFRGIREGDFVNLMKTPRVIDARRIYDPSRFVATDFAAVGVGPRATARTGNSYSISSGGGAINTGDSGEVPMSDGKVPVTSGQRMITGAVVKNDERYVVTDYSLPDGLTLSTTELKPNKATRGHSHPTPEFYIFFDECNLTLGSEVRAVKVGDIVHVGPNEFHKVEAAGRPCRFVSLFWGERASVQAIYADHR